jgi:DNA-binding HxlR family transcriptional regulator
MPNVGFINFFKFVIKSKKMNKRKIKEDLDCGIRITLKVFGGKWKFCIIDAISKGITRPVEIHKSISDSTIRVIEMQLAELLFFGVVTKCSENVYPKKSDYKLTALGESFLPILNHIDKWGLINSEFVKEKQQEFDEIN